MKPWRVGPHLRDSGGVGVRGSRPCALPCALGSRWASGRARWKVGSRARWLWAPGAGRCDGGDLMRAKTRGEKADRGSAIIRVHQRRKGGRHVLRAHGEHSPSRADEALIERGGRPLESDEEGGDAPCGRPLRAGIRTWRRAGVLIARRGRACAGSPRPPLRHKTRHPESGKTAAEGGERLWGAPSASRGSRARSRVHLLGGGRTHSPRRRACAESGAMRDVGGQLAALWATLDSVLSPTATSTSPSQTTRSPRGTVPARGCAVALPFWLGLEEAE